MKKGLQVVAARPAQPMLWTATLDRVKGSKHHSTLITCQLLGPEGPDSRWARREDARVLAGRRASTGEDLR